MSMFLLRTWMFLRRNLWVRRFDEIHVEAIYTTEAYHKLGQYLKKNSLTQAMLICPLQDQWQRGRFQGSNVNEEEYQQKVRKRYEALSEYINWKGMHVHLYGPCSIRIPSYEEQYAMIKQAKDYFDEFDERIAADFAPGWNRYNADTIKVCERLGVKRFHVSQYLRGCEHSSKLKFKMVYNIGHDWSLK